MDDRVAAQPDDWTVVADLCASVAEQLTAVVARTVQGIRAAVTDYEALVPPADLERAATQHLTMMLEAIADRASPAPAQVASRAAFVRRRAAQGVSADSLLRAFYVGHRELLVALAQAAADQADPQATTMLPQAVDVALRWVQDFTAELVAEHHAFTSARRLMMSTQQQHLIDMLGAGEPAADCIDAARALDLDPDGSFQACWLADQEPATSHRLEQRTRLLPGRVVVGRYARGVAVLWQHRELAPVRAAVTEILPDVPTGVGLVRQGLRGAHLSLVDATLAIRLSDGGPEEVDYADVWLASLALESGERVATLLSTAVEVAEDNPHLAAAVTAFADCGFSLAAAARSLHVHANTLTYRLDRWQLLTGDDPRSGAGMLVGLLAARIVAAGEGGRSRRPG